MRDYFDAIVYVTNWGSRRSMFRIPLSLIDTKKVELYCVSEEINAIATKEGVVLGINFHDEELAEWTEGKGWLDELVELREELIQGDFRVLYLAWLKAAENALGLEGIDKDTMEPPVPLGLNQLSDALKTFVRFLVPLEKYFYIHGKNIFYYVSNPAIGMALRRILTSSNFLNSSDLFGLGKVVM